MAQKRRSKRIVSVSLDSLRVLNNLIPYRLTESHSARADKLAIAVLQKFFGPEWIEEYVSSVSKDRFLQLDFSTPLARETSRMRRILFAEMLYNLQHVKEFHTCVTEIAGGQIESTYAALDVARMITTMAVDKGITFRFVTPSGLKKRDYDLSIAHSEGVQMRAETKCKLEETKISLRTIEQSLSDAKKQLPERVPGIVFVKVPRRWIDDETFADGMRKLALRFLARSPSIVSIKYYMALITRNEETDGGETVGEIVAFYEQANENHRFKHLKGRDLHMFPSTPPAAPPSKMQYNGMPSTWQRLVVWTTNLSK